MVNTPNKYEKGTIYKIMSTQSDCVYIGSTTNLVNRLSHHKYMTKLKHAGKIVKNVRSLEITCLDEWKLEVIELYPCMSKKQLENRERFWIEQHPTCINHVIPTRSRTEYFQVNEEQKEKARCRENLYYLNNKEQCKAHFSEKIVCHLCQCHISRIHILRHQKTDKCKNNRC